jgi:hypothetical protein
MSDNLDLGRVGINDCIENIQRVNREKTGLYIVQLFVNAKRDELINVYTQAAPMDKTKAVNILKEIDPANSSRYQQIMQQK